MEQELRVFSTKERAKYEFKSFIENRTELINVLFPIKASIAELRIECSDRIIFFVSNDDPDSMRGRRFDLAYIDEDLRGIRHHEALGYALNTAQSVKWLETSDKGEDNE